MVKVFSNLPQSATSLTSREPTLSQSHEHAAPIQTRHDRAAFDTACRPSAAHTPLTPTPHISTTKTYRCSGLPQRHDPPRQVFSCLGRDQHLLRSGTMRRSRTAARSWPRTDTHPDRHVYKQHQEPSHRVSLRPDPPTFPDPPGPRTNPPPTPSPRAYSTSTRATRENPQLSRSRPSTCPRVAADPTAVLPTAAPDAETARAFDSSCDFVGEAE